jgi:hypothetical protein
MDASLAKGYKRQVFQQLEKEVDKIISDWQKVTKTSKVIKNRFHWKRYIEKLEAIFKKNLILKQLGGSNKKPYIALSVLTAGDQKFNQWQEKCFTSIQILINFDPWYVEVLPAGFSVSEHTIQRIFQRKFDNSNDYSFEDSGLREIVDELILAPLWSSYWIQEAIRRFANSDISKINPIIPTPLGLLLGEINRNHTGKIEIRTFVSDNLLSVKQMDLKRKMLDINKEFEGSNLSFFPIIDITVIESSEIEAIRMGKLVTFADEVMSINFKS